MRSAAFPPCLSSHVPFPAILALLTAQLALPVSRPLSFRNPLICTLLFYSTCEWAHHIRTIQQQGLASSETAMQKVPLARDAVRRVAIRMGRQRRWQQLHAGAAARGCMTTYCCKAVENPLCFCTK